MTSDRELMQQALETLEYARGELAAYHEDAQGEDYNNPALNDTITALRERLAQPEQYQRPTMRRATREEKIDRPGVYWVPVNNIANSEAIPEQISEQEPVGEIVQAFADLTAVSIPIMPPVGTKLYTTPPRREWVGLTKEEAKEISLANRPYVVDMIAALEARLKEKNNG